ncbi:MAG: ATP-dependent DNA helicase, partial [Acidimicrobiales bacterium]
MPADDVVRTLQKVTAALPGGGEDRPGQVAMAEAVAGAIERERHLVVQAGTGTGKSLAYAVPAALSGRTVVVATATKALQDQLATKDLPSVAAALDRPLDVAVLKGRSNYLCLQRAGEVAGDGHQQSLDQQPGETGHLVDQVRRLLRWGGETDSGDRGELDFEPDGRAWAMVSVGPRECPGAARCPSGDRCFAERARRRAADADVVVVNTHLYGAHLASGGTVLPPHDVVVFDEAHEVEEVMTASLGVDLPPGRLSALHTAARPLVGDAAGLDLDGVAERLRGLLADRIGERVLRGAPAGSVGSVAAAGSGPEERER